MAPALIVRQSAQERGSLLVTDDQRNTIIVACIYVLAILILVCHVELIVVEYPYPQTIPVPI